MSCRAYQYVSCLRHRLGRLAAAVAVLSLLVFVPAASASPQAPSITISMLAYVNQQPAYTVLIANFERVYPNITVVPTYAATVPNLQQLEPAELAAGNAPDLLTVQPACGTPISVCVLAKDGYLAPMVGKAWVKRSLPLVTSADKYGAGLFAFSPQISPYGIFTNDALFKKLGLKVPETFSQLLDVCRQARSNGVSALVSDSSGGTFSRLVQALSVGTVYATNSKWTAQLRAGQATFEGSPGWHEALQELSDMNGAGCFEPGVLRTTSTPAAIAGFAQGQGLMFANTSSQKGLLDAANPQFDYTFHPFPGGSASGEAVTALNLNMSPSVNARSSAQNQAAAQTFIDFIARPKQAALYAQISGGLTQYEFLKGEFPSFLADLAPVLARHQYVVLPEQTWWNPAVIQGLQQSPGLLTGQRSVDDILNAMDAAWKQGPA